MWRERPITPRVLSEANACAHSRLNRAASVVLGFAGAALFLAYLMSSFHLVVEIIIVVPYKNPCVHPTPDVFGLLAPTLDDLLL